MRFFFTLIVLLLTTVLAWSQINQLEQKLIELSDVSFERIATPNGFEAAYVLFVNQPLDHNAPSKGSFRQRVFLSHRGFDNISTIITEGYQRNRNRIYELTELLHSNQIQVEHRYYGASLPDTMDYTFLTLEQATADLHHIKELMDDIYTGKWVSTGISKGGQTTIFYRYFFPDDVDVSVPYVAPLTLDFEDTRIYTFLDTVGTQECRDGILAAQKRMLENREQALNSLEWYSRGANLKFTYHTLEEAFEFAVLEYPFSFWQWGTSCADLPSDTTSFDDFMKHFISVSGVDFFSDEQVNAYSSHYYQAASQMGYYGYETEELKGLLKALPITPHPHAAFTPNKMKVEFDNSVPVAANKWLKSKGNRFLYIYGASDTWSACGVRPTEGVDADWFYIAGKDHSAARFKNMSAKAQTRFLSQLEKWLDVKIENPFTEEE